MIMTPFFTIVNRCQQFFLGNSEQVRIHKNSHCEELCQKEVKKL